jgi:immune inhibitor A
MPHIEEAVIRAKRLLKSGADMTAAVEGTDLDPQGLMAILSRSPKTREHTFAAPAERAPVIGTRKALVLLVDFSDKPASETQAHYNDMLFSLGTHSTGSMRDFYREASYGKLDVVGVVSGVGGPTAGWYRAPQPKSYYTDGNFGFNPYPKNAQKLVEDVVDLADPHVNFADYDNDGDGVVDALVIVAAGTGAEGTGNVNDIWSHKWSIAPRTRDGVQIKGYFMAPEDGRVGVFSHELGHLLMAWPDLYDIDYSSAGTGRWDLMAGGSWNNGGDTPAHPTCWCKYRVGWVTPTVIFNAEQSVTIKPYATDPQVYKLPIGSTSSAEYFLVSNRKKTRFDSHLPGEGLIIEHVDEGQSNNTNENHYMVDIEQCDGQFHLNKNANRGDTADPFPCSANAEFTKDTTPSSEAYGGSDSGVLIKQIQRSGDNIKVVLRNGNAIAWHWNCVLKATYATHHSESAWAYITTLGWRRIRPGVEDGVTNILESCSEALANNRMVHVFVDATYLYRVVLV